MELPKGKRRRTRSISCMRIDKIVGSGTFGVVYKATDKMTDRSVALKKIKMERETQGFPVTAIREIKILNLVRNHKNIVNLFEVVTYNGDETDEPTVTNKGFNIGDIFMVFEFVEFDLSGLLKSSGLILTDNHVKSFLMQLLEGVKFLHDNNILHRDIKSANLLVTKGNVLKIADWGLARSVSIHPDRRLTNPVVTLWYRSPELILGSRFYGPEVDIWSVGCILGEMKTRVAMFRGESEASQLDLIFQATGSPGPALLVEFKKLPDWDKLGFNKTYLSRMNTKFQHVHDKQFFAILDKLLDLNPTSRITASKALQDPYFSGYIPTPAQLPTFNIEPVTEWMEQERQKEERAAQQAQQEAREKARVEREAAMAQQKQAVGRGMAGEVRKQRRQSTEVLNKYVAVRPNAAAVTSGLANTAVTSSVAVKVDEQQAPGPEDESQAKKPRVDEQA